ncbi:YidC/Oxa1 family membrane protein insertase [Streptomyces kronopolitis]|uniref:YidC/Oxa1 family membrane protein insertase n=1 Tax=Streptomyces kronopolitis TaxID=1612435 RepID=UPI00367A6FEA
MSMFGFLGAALTHAADALTPLFGTAAMAATIVLCTLGVRAALHPLARAAARGEKARSALAPRMAELQRTHKGNPERLQKAIGELYADSGSSPLAGCLPMLLQLPVFFVMYHLFSRGAGGLLDHTLLGAPLGGHWTQALADGGVLGPQGLVYLALFALITAVATWNFRRARATLAKAPAPAVGGTNAALPGMASMSRLMPLLSFGTLITIAVVPLAAGLYVVTTTTWTACERALLHRDRKPAPEPAGDTAAETVPDVPAAARRPAPRRAPKTRAARQRAARSRANSRTAAARSAAGTAPADGATAPTA